MITTAEGTVNLLYAPYLDGYGYPLATIGTLAALFAILRLLSRVPSGALYRPARAKPLLVAWLIVFTLSTSGFFFAGGLLPLVIALTVVHGFAFGSLGTVNLATTIDLAGGRRAGTVMGWYTAGISTGYALGASLHRALSGVGLHGELPSNNTMLAMRKVLSHEPEISASLPPGAREVIAAAIDPNQAARPATAAELAERIDAINDEVL